MSLGGKKLLFGALTALVVVAAVEVIALLATIVVFGSGPGEAVRMRRELLTRAGSALPEVEGGRSAAPIRLREIDAEQALHPFLGFVNDPALNLDPERKRRRALAVTPEGFFRRPGPLPEYEGKDVQVGIFGGSFAMLFAFTGREALQEELAEVPALQGKSVGFRSYALGGYQQPQQLMALNYLLVRGHPLGLVIELDGFNELVLAWLENYRHGVAPFYPRNWRQRVEGTPRPGFLKAAGRMLDLADLRAALARRFEHPGIRWSPVGNLVWRLVDRKLADRQASAELEARAAGKSGHDFAETGPFEPFATRTDFLVSQARLWQRASLQMHQLCQARGIPYFHFLQPNQYVPGSKPMGHEERSRAFDPDSPQRKVIEEGYPLLQQMGAELRQQGVHFFDLTGVFEDQDTPLYTDACCHVGSKGNRLLGHRLGRMIATALAGEAVPAGVHR